MHTQRCVIIDFVLDQMSKCDSDRQRFSAVLSALLQQTTSSGNEVEPVELPLHLTEALLERNSLKQIRNRQGCVDTSFEPQLLSAISKQVASEEGPEVSSRLQETRDCSREYSVEHPELVRHGREGNKKRNTVLTACEELEPVMRSSQGRHDAHDFSQQNIAETDQAETWQDGKVQTGNSGAYQGRETQTGNSEMYQEREAETGNTMIHQQREVQTGNTDPAKMLQFAEKALLIGLTGNLGSYEERKTLTGSLHSAIIFSGLSEDSLTPALLDQEYLNAFNHQQLEKGINVGAYLNALLENWNRQPPEEVKMKVKLRLREGLGYLQKFGYLMPSSGTLPSEEQKRTALQRCEGLLKQAYKIVNKYQDNKDVIVHCLDIFEVQSLVEKCDKLFSKSVDLNIEGLAADRRFKQAYAAVRESFADIRRNVARWRDRVLHSIVPMFTEGAFSSCVRKLMSRDVARFGKGGNGELVEAFQSGQEFVVKKTLLRESEWSVVTHMDHPNVMPWLALICGDRSDTKPGQVVSYQIMPKMTEDLSASISKMGGSIHHYILQLQEAEEPNSVLSTRADLVRQRGAEILRRVLQGLDYMHKQNLVHRDIKASNILLKKPVGCPHDTVHTCTCPGGWEVRVADFDSVIHLNVARERAQRRKQLKVGNTGTSGYRAPEVFFESSTSDINDEEYYSPASDIWSFGGVCLHLAMGFCCPRMQYQVSLITLASHGLVNIPADEVQEKVDKTVGIYHIRQGFTGEKWQDMINFTSRPLEVDRCKRPSAETLLKDSFLMQAHAVQSATDNKTKDDR